MRRLGHVCIGATGAVGEVTGRATLRPGCGGVPPDADAALRQARW
jgi:hypothetical protein